MSAYCRGRPRGETGCRRWSSRRGGGAVFADSAAADFGSRRWAFLRAAAADFGSRRPVPVVLGGFFFAVHETFSGGRRICFAYNVKFFYNNLVVN